MVGSHTLKHDLSYEQNHENPVHLIRPGYCRYLDAAQGQIDKRKAKPEKNGESYCCKNLSALKHNEGLTPFRMKAAPPKTNYSPPKVLKSHGTPMDQNLTKE